MADPIQEIQDLLVDCKTLVIASRARIYYEPHASYAPFLYQDGCFYILVSELARHAFNLADGRLASIMIIRDESDSPNLFARHRLTLDCTAEEVPWGGDYDWPKVTDAMKQRFGGIIKQLCSFHDMHLFRFIPKKGRYICGFGEAYRVNGTLDQADPITGEGHKTVDPDKNS
jgi:hypothetical protein